MINEIAEELLEASQETAFPLELPDMDDIIEAQEIILIHIPLEFRDYLLNASSAIYGHLEPVTVADPHSHTYLPDIAAEAWSQGMPREYVPLCQKNDSYYCVAEDDTVYLWNPGDEEPEQVNDNVWHWVRDVWLRS